MHKVTSQLTQIVVRKWQGSYCYNKPIKNPNNNACNKKGDKNKKDNNIKSEDKGNNNAGTADVHEGEVTPDKDKPNTSRDSSSIGVHTMISLELFYYCHDVYMIFWQKIQ